MTLIALFPAKIQIIILSEYNFDIIMKEFIQRLFCRNILSVKFKIKREEL